MVCQQPWFTKILQNDIKQSIKKHNELCSQWSQQWYPSFEKKSKNLKVQLVSNLSDTDYKIRYATIRNKVRYMERAIRRRNSRKLSRNKSNEYHNINNKMRKSRCFSKKQLINKKKLKRKRHKNNYRERIHFAEVNGLDQNAISLFYQKDHLLYQQQKT